MNMDLDNSDCHYHITLIGEIDGVTTNPMFKPSPVSPIIFINGKVPHSEDSPVFKIYWN